MADTKFYMGIVQNRDVKALFEYPTYDDALVAFHQEMAYRSEKRTSTLCFIFDDNGAFYNTELWVKPEPEQPIVEEEETELSPLIGEGD